MSDSNTSNSNSGLYFIVGILLAAVVGFGIYYYNANGADAGPDLSIEVDENGIEVDGN